MNALQIVVISAIVASAAAANPTGRRLFSSGSASAYGSASGSSSAYGSAYTSGAAKPAAKATCCSTCTKKCGYTVTMSFTLKGVTASDFEKPKVVIAFKNTMAAKLGLAADQITNVKAVAARRRAGDAKVTFDIKVADEAAATKQKTAATAFLKSGFTAAFKAEAKTQGVESLVFGASVDTSSIKGESKSTPISGASSLKPALVLPALLAAAYLY